MHASAGLCACRTCPWPSHRHRRGQRIEQEDAKLRPAAAHVHPHRDSMIHLLRTGNIHRPCGVQAESGQTLHTGLSPDAGAPAAAPNQAAHPLIKG